MPELTHGMNCSALSPGSDDDCTCGLRYRIEIERLKQLINRDKTGLANALNAVRQVLRGYSWIPAGEWGSYEWHERTEKAFRDEIGRCFDEAEKIAVDALRASGDLANEAFHGQPIKPVQIHGTLKEWCDGTGRDIKDFKQ